MLTPKFTLIIAVIAIVIFVANETGIFEGNNPAENTIQQYSIETNDYQPKNTLLPPSEPTPFQNELTSHLSQAGPTRIAFKTVAISHVNGFPILPQNLASPQESKASLGPLLSIIHLSKENYNDETSL